MFDFNAAIAAVQNACEVPPVAIPRRKRVVKRVVVDPSIGSGAFISAAEKLSINEMNGVGRGLSIR